jgi:hypothetical protein
MYIYYHVSGNMQVIYNKVIPTYTNTFIYSHRYNTIYLLGKEKAPHFRAGLSGGAVRFRRLRALRGAS